MFANFNRFHFAAFLFIAQLAVTAFAQDEKEIEEEVEKPPKLVTAIRIVGPEKLNHGPNLVGVQVKYEGKNDWKLADAEEFELSITGEAATLTEDISQRPVNPVLIEANSKSEQEILVRATAGEQETEKRFVVQQLEARKTLSIAIDPEVKGHAYTGMGAGVMFYDNQFTIDKSLFDWCFKDVDTQILHILIRPDFEPVNDNDDWQVLNQEAFNWEKCNRLFWICWNARQRNKNLSVYACLYSPPAWTKANDDTSGQAGLKKGERYKLEMAEYVYAFLKHAAWKGTKIDYLCMFNEPDFPHKQDGTYYESLAELAQTQAFVREKVEQLIDADPNFNHKPVFVFPETLGPGSITRAGDDTKELAELTGDGLLDHLGVWGVHDYWNSGGDYWDNRYQELRDFPGVGDRPIWMTEWAQRFPRGDIASSNEYGQKILNALRLGASAWLAFEWAHPAPNQAGLVSTQWGKGVTKKRFWRSKSYYLFKQIANTSPAGGEILPIQIDTGDKKPDRSIEALAIRKEGKLVVHMHNSKNRPVKYSISINDEEFQIESARITDPSTNDTEIERSTDDDLPPYSLTTLIYSKK